MNIFHVDPLDSEMVNPSTTITALMITWHMHYFKRIKVDIFLAKKIILNQIIKLFLYSVNVFCFQDISIF